MAGGSPHIRPLASGITPCSHVTQDAKGMTNAGRASAAGKGRRCVPWSGTCQTLKSGSGAQVETGSGHGLDHALAWAVSAARQSRSVGVSRVVPGTSWTACCRQRSAKRSREPQRKGRLAMRPIERSDGWGLFSVVDFRGWKRLRPQGASRERCRLRWRPATGVVRASARAVFWEVLGAERV
jgi:hypothetical protein